MTITLLFMSAVMIVVSWWLLKQSVDTKPWESNAHYPAGEDFSGRSFTQPDSKLGLIVFLTVVTSMFSLFISAYMMRMKLGDWRPLTEPELLWLNTGALVLSSISLQWAAVASRREQKEQATKGLLIGGFFAFAFMVGQWLAWQQLIDAGYFAYTNPSYAFFYLITGLHALHLLGGLVVWGVTTNKLLGGIELARLRITIELCAMYWHFLLVVWVILFGLLLST